MLAQSKGFVMALAREWTQIVLRIPQSDATRALQDKSVATIAAERGAQPVDAFFDVILEGNLEDQWGALVMNYDEDRIAPMLRHPAGVVALSDAGAHMDTLCDQGFTSYLLGHWVRERGVLSLEEAVRLVTSKPAALYGLNDRGILAPGKKGDLNVIDLERLENGLPEVAFDLPAGAARFVQRARGYEATVVSGEITFRNGEHTGALPGRLVRGAQN